MKKFFGRINTELPSPFNFRKSLRSQLTLVIGASIAMVFLMGSLWVMLMIYQAEKTSWEARQQEAAVNAANTIGSFLDEMKNVVSLIDNIGQDELRYSPNALNLILKNSPTLTEIVYINPQGEVIASATQKYPVLAEMLAIAQTTWFKQAMQGQNYIGTPQISPGGETYLIIAMPSSASGVIAARLKLTSLWGVVTNIHFGKTGIVYIITQDGDIIAHPNQQILENHTSLTGRPELEDFLKSPGFSWHGTYVNFQGVPVVSTTAAIPGTSWLVVTEVKQFEASATTRNSWIALTVFLLVFGTLTIAGTIMVLDRMVLHPMEDLHTGAIQLGKGNLNYRVHLPLQNEIGRVGQAFNQMAEDLCGHDRELKRLNEELEERIRHRTTELRISNEQLMQEINERMRIEHALRESEERYALASQGSNDGIWDWDIQGNSVYFSPRWKAMLGYKDYEIGNSPNEWFDRVHPDDLEHLRQRISYHMKGKAEHLESEYRIQHKDGHYVWVLCHGLAVKDTNNEPYRMAGSQADITLRKLAEEKLVYDALHDSLTGLPNRALLVDRLNHAIERAQRHKDYLYAVLFLDFDRFKLINDSMGHTTGDNLLIASAQRLGKCLRSSDTIARQGGDEFVILLEEIKSHEDAELVAEKLQEALSHPIVLDEKEINITASIGITMGTTDYKRPEDVLRDADIAMYRAKAMGKARHEIFDPTQRTEIIELLTLENELRRAIDRNELELHYQPIYALQNQHLAGFEALLRWKHPEFGNIPPSRFIPLAEDTGLIIPIGKWVMETAIRQLALWRIQSIGSQTIYVAVNVSSRQISHPGLVTELRDMLEQNHLPARHLMLEITESTLMENQDTCITTLNDLRKVGVRLSIDDFGTGYSSLGYLQRFPIDTIKIDRSFISQIGITGHLTGIVRTILRLASELDLKVVAEGIENNLQLTLLRKMGCKYGQGYLLGRPQRAEEATDLFQRKSHPYHKDQ